MRFGNTAGSGAAELPGTSVQRQALQNIPDGSSTKVAFDTLLYDDLGWWNPIDPNYIVVDSDGRYQISFNMTWDYTAFTPPSGKNIQNIAVQDILGVPTAINGVLFSSIIGTPNETSGVIVVEALAADRFSLVAYQATGGVLSLYHGTPGAQPYTSLTVTKFR